ncbi:ABC transporter ATP-binding protein [bacterium]|nr:ABC transporter ATP-binding protein [bacterium]
MKLSETSAKNSFRYSWLLQRAFPFIKPVLTRAILGVLVAIPVGALDGVVALALKPYMDYVVGQKDLIFTMFGSTHTISCSTLALIIPFAVIFFAVFQGVLRYLNGYLTDWTSQKITNAIKIALFNRLVYMDTAFFDENPSGSIITRYLTDPDTASKNLVNSLKNIITGVFGALSLICVMLYSSWRLAIIGVVVLCIAFVPVALIRKRIKRTSNKNMVIDGNITTNFNETYSGNRVMRAYGLENRQKEIFKENIINSFNNNMSLVKRAGWMSPLMYLIASFGIAIVLWYGTHLITSGIMTAGSFASFVTSLLLLYKPVKTLGKTLTDLQNIFVALGRVFELFDIEPELKDTPTAIKLSGLNDSISFNNVYFEYQKGHPVIKNLNLFVNKGETIAIVGNSGGGKSTIVNLIARFYDVTAGSVCIDNIDIRNYTLKSLRSNISFVFQDNFLFSGTIRENILMGNPSATTEELFEVVKAAHLEEMLDELPDGIDTVIGERGTSLSGGQRQRVAIARAMIKKAPVVILDEATSALDNKSEAVVQKALDNLMKNRTVFVIAHRLSTIQNADRIAVINEGELVELGTHDELMKLSDGQYKALYTMQFKNQEPAVVN